MVRKYAAKKDDMDAEYFLYDSIEPLIKKTIDIDRKGGVTMQNNKTIQNKIKKLTINRKDEHLWGAFFAPIFQKDMPFGKNASYVRENPVRIYEGERFILCQV